MNTPQKTKKDNAIVFGLTSKLIFAVASVMMDIKRHSPGFVDEVIIFHDGKLKESDKKILQTILPTRFETYNFPLEDKKDKLDQVSLKAYTHMIFASIESFRLLNEFHNVIWLDYDILVTDDISDMASGSPYDFSFGTEGRISRDLFRQPIEGYNMNVMSANAGIFVIKDTIPEFNKVYEFCYDILEKHGNNMSLGDQSVYFLVIEHFKLNHGILPDNYVIDIDQPAIAGKTKIIHAAGSYKFWNCKERANKQWTANYKEWVRMGGTKSRDMMFYKKIKKKIKSWLKK